MRVDTASHRFGVTSLDPGEGRGAQPHSQSFSLVNWGGAGKDTGRRGVKFDVNSPAKFPGNCGANRFKYKNFGLRRNFPRNLAVIYIKFDPSAPCGSAGVERTQIKDWRE